eukprot:GHUV01046968.1.p1 GENE.GHUV01046968.1~~GHUV01046968.1.p1  ORF type:complete len:155 (-),score=5.39 GHUV01046968.1:75-539(-)
MWGMEMMTFNIKDGYSEAIVRGHKSGLLTVPDYNNLTQCEALDDIKLNLVSLACIVRHSNQKAASTPYPAGMLSQTATDYGSYLANEASPLYTSTIVDRCTQKLVEDWNAMRCQVWTLVVLCSSRCRKCHKRPSMTMALANLKSRQLWQGVGRS